jgi:hypothetical protein
MLAKISEKTHRPFAEILQQLPREVVQPALSYPGIFPLINPATLEEQALAEEITKRMI